MAIRNPDGSLYRVVGSRQQFDPENPDLELFDLWDAEAIEVGGSPIFYYEVFIQPQTVDPIYWEDRGKIWSTEPVQLYAVYEPVQPQNLISNFGFDSPDDVMFELNVRATLNAIGHPPRIGSKVFTPHKREWWEIVERKLTEWKMWGEIRLQLFCKRYQDSLTHGDQPSPPEVDFKLHQNGSRFLNGQ
jgi:hypothetical protein